MENLHLFERYDNLYTYARYLRVIYDRGNLNYEWVLNIESRLKSKLKDIDSKFE